MIWRRGWLALWLLLSTLGASGCCRLLDMLPQPVEDEDDDLPNPSGGGKTPEGSGPSSANQVDLGDAAYPPEIKTTAVSHLWKSGNDLTPRNYRLGYMLDDSGEKGIESDYHNWANRLGYRKLSKSRFQWRPPQRCMNGLHCVYEELAAQDDAAIEPLVERFQKRIDEANLNALQATSLVVTFGQEVTYRIPDEQPFGVMPPALVVERKNGDCDSKSLLTHMILRRLGIHSVLISSKAHAHTMLGVALPAPGSSFSYDGRRYAFVELTAKRSPIGHINPSLLRPNDWRVDPLPYQVGKKASTGTPRTPMDQGKRSVETPMNTPVGGGPIRIEQGL